MTPIRGTDKECLAHFLDSHDWAEVQKLTAEFVGVRKTAVRTWKNGTSWPVGEKLIRARVLLELAGYKVEELESIPGAVRRFGQMMAYDELLTVADAQQYLGYKTTKDLYRVVLTGSGMMQDRQFQLEKMVRDQDYIRELKQLMETTREQLAAMSSASSQGSSVSGRSSSLVKGDGESAASTSRVRQGLSQAARNEQDDQPVQESASSRELMARSLVDAVQLVASLTAALQADPGEKVGLVTVNFALGQSNLNAAYQALGAIRSARD